jgi:prepilin-type N-terminal cleavage/methylation domain-containing protein
MSSPLRHQPAPHAGLRIRGRSAPPAARGRVAGRRGFTMLEVLIVVMVLTIAMTMVTGTMASASKLGPLQRERARASEAARAMLELLRIEPFHRVFELYNTDTEDDPAGPGTAPGPHFEVEGLPVPEGDADGMCGRVRLPEAKDASGLFETVVDPRLGLPRDLNGNGEIDEDAVTVGYTLLPVEIIVEWESQGQVHQFAIQTMFVEPPE